MAAAAACAAAGCVLDSLEWSIALMAQWWAWLESDNCCAQRVVRRSVAERRRGGRLATPFHNAKHI